MPTKRNWEKLTALPVHLCEEDADGVIWAEARISKLEQQIEDLKAERDAAVDALQWIADACDVPGECSGCGKPNGIPAIRSHALRHLPTPPEVEI